MDIALFDYHLPKELIAQRPIEPRDASRMLVLPKEAGGGRGASGKSEIAGAADGSGLGGVSGQNEIAGVAGQSGIIHDRFYHLSRYLCPGDLLVFNRTRVLPARLLGRKAESGGQAECFLLHQVKPDMWRCLVRPGRRLAPGTRLIFGDGALEGIIEERTGEGGRLVRFVWQGDFETVLNQTGQVPLPPYIRESLADPERYQTVYGDRAGSAAAPTAGLHFTKQTLAELAAMGVEQTEVLLHVGLGTFRPVEAGRIEEHKMHKEYYEVSDGTAAAVNRAKREGRRVIAVGTTAVRTLEAMGSGDFGDSGSSGDFGNSGSGDSGGVLRAGSGWTDIFIYPGYRFKIIDGLLTNFHLPKSTLLMLVSALAGRERVLAAYEEAIREKYRFFSFGDAMLMV